MNDKADQPEMMSTIRPEDDSWVSEYTNMLRDKNKPHEPVGGMFAMGGIAPGYGNRDTVPAMLTPGEFVVNKSATNNNIGMLKAINSGHKISKFNDGGGVGFSASAGISFGFGSGAAKAQNTQPIVLDSSSFTSSVRDFNDSMGAFSGFINSLNKVADRLTKIEIPSVEVKVQDITVSVIGLEALNNSVGSSLEEMFNTRITSIVGDAIKLLQIG